MPEQMTDKLGRISDYYERLIRQDGYDPRACDFGRPESQEIKFRVLGEVMPLADRSLLDVRRGFAAELTPWVVLRHDYHPCDFTVYMYKTPRT